MSARNSLQRGLMRPGDHHLREDSRQMFGNYVELSPLGGTAAFLRVRKSSMFIATPVYEAPKLWQIELQFSAPRGVPPSTVPVPPSPWLPEDFNMRVNVRITSALDRDKQTETETIALVPLGVALPNEESAFPTRYQQAQQLQIAIEVFGTTPQVLGVQGSVVEVHSGSRDGYGNAFTQQFAQSAVTGLFLPANARRRQFFVQNLSAAPLYIAFNRTASVPGGSPPNFAAITLPNGGDIYESPRDCWLGNVAGVWGAAGAGFALVTEGT